MSLRQENRFFASLRMTEVEAQNDKGGGAQNDKGGGAQNDKGGGAQNDKGGGASE